MIFTLEIGGRAVMAFTAEDRMWAEKLIEEETFRSDLTVYEHEGRPLWDGRTDLFLREAFGDEVERFQAARSRAIRSGEMEDGEDFVTFLVAVTDPTDVEPEDE
jgi:hypothetical protein